MMTRAFALSVWFLLGALDVHGQAMNAGDVGRLTFPVSLSTAIASPQTIQVQVTPPSGITILPSSLLGPQTIFPGKTYNVRVDFQAQTNFSPMGPRLPLTVTIGFIGSAVLPSTFTWQLSSQNGFFTTTGNCTDSSGFFCGSYGSPDTTPPVTTLSFSSGTTYTVGTFVYLSSSVLIQLSAIDPSLTDAGTSGIEGIAYSTSSTNTTFFDLDSDYLSPFSLAEGTYTLQFASEDRDLSVEALHSQQLIVDATPPTTQLQFFASNMIGLVATDPVVNGASSGISTTSYSLDGGSFGVYRSSFVVSEGTHTISYFSADNVGNVETIHTATFTVQSKLLSAVSSWPTGRHDQTHTGLAGSVGPLQLVPQWTFSSGSFLLFGEPTLGPDGTIYIAERQNASTFNLLAINPNGTLKWRAFTDGGHFTSTVRGDGTIYVGGERLSAFRPDGTTIWYFDSGEGGVTDAISNPVISTDGFVWAASFEGTYGQNLMKVDPNTGAILMKIPVSTVMAPALGPDGTIYVASYDGHLYAYRTDGSTKWSAPLASTSLVRAPVVHPNGRICVPTSTFVQCFNSDGTTAWTFNNGRSGSSYSYALSIAPDGTILAVDNQNVYALAANDGSLKWKFTGYTFSQNQNTQGIVDAAGTFYVPAFLGSQNLLIAISSSGSLLSSQTISGGAGLNTPIIDAQGNLYLGDSSANLTKYSSPNPAYLATTATPWPASRHDFARSALAGSVGPGLPGSRWTFNAGSFFLNGEASIGLDGTIYVSERQDANTFNLMAVNPNGSLKWRALTGGGHDSSVVRADGTIYVGGTRLWAIAPNGTAIWSVDSGKGTANNSFSTPVIAPDGSVWSEAYYTGNLVKVNPINGTIQQQVAINSVNPPAIGSDGTMYLGGVDGNLYAVGQDGGVRWTFATAGSSLGTAAQAPLVHPNGFILVSGNRYVQAVNSNGSLAWTFDNGISGDKYSFALAVGPDGTIYANDNQNVFALNPSNGLLKWKYSDGVNQFNTNGNLSQAMVVDASGSVFLGASAFSSANPNRIVALTSSGTLRWTYPIPGTLGLVRPILDSSGNILIGDDSGNLTAIGNELVASSTNSIRGSPELQVASTVSGLTVTATSTNTTTVALALGSATAQGLALVSDVFDLSPSQSFSPAATLTFRFDPTVVTDTTTLEIYRFDGVSWSSAGFISNQVVTLGADPQVTATLAHSSYYGLFRKGDVFPPRTAIVAGAPQFSSGQWFVTDATTFTLAAVDDYSISGDGKGLGVAQTYVAIDTAVFSAYNWPFALSAEGSHSIQYFSVDLLGNSEVAHSTQVAVDVTPPVTQLQVLASSATDVFGGIATTTNAAIILVSADPLSAGVASGVSDTFYVVDADPFSPACLNTPLDVTAPPGTCANELYQGSFTLSVGTHTVYFLSEDNVGNQEQEHVVGFTISIPDTRPPRTTLVIGKPSSGANPVYISTTTPLILQAIDDLTAVGDGIGSGIAQSFYSLDSSSFGVYGGTFTIASPGPHSINYYSVDFAGNTEAIHTSTVSVDVAAPALSVIPSSGTDTNTSNPFIAAVYSAAPGISTSAVRLTLDGLDVTAQAVLTASSASFTPASALADGAHSVSAFVADNLGNQATAGSTFIIDTVAPVTTLVAGVPHFSSTTVYVATTTPLSFTVSQPAQTSYAIDNASFTAFGGSFTLSVPGSHVIRYFSTDFAGNVEKIRISTVSVDVLPPRTSFAAGTPSYSSATLYAAAETTFSLTSVDDLSIVGDTQGSGVAQTLIAVDTATYSVYSGTFSLAAEGLHSIAFFSIDQLSNQENARSAQVSIDLTPPVTQLAISGPSTTTAAGWSGISTATIISLSATDPISSGVASGVENVYYVIDQDPFSPSCAGTPLDPTQPAGTCANETYQGPFTLPAGIHTIYFLAQDNVGNQSNVQIASFTVDGLPPRTTLVIGQPRFGAATVFVSAATQLSLSGVDDLSSVGDGLGLGAAATFISIDSATFGAYPGPFSLTTQGNHSIQFYSVDAVANAESVRSQTVSVDTTAPSTQLLVDGVPTAASSLALAATDTLSLSASDLGAGVATTYLKIDGGPQQLYTSSFTVPAGAHTLAFQSIDNVGNAEATRTVAASVRAPDVTPPSLALTPVTGSSVTAASPSIFLVFADTDTGINPGTIRLGVDGTDVTSQSVVTASSVSFRPSSALAQGQHIVTASAADNAGNVAYATATWVLDSIPPVTTLSINGTPVPGPITTAFASDTFTLSATDSGTGVASTLVSIDGGPEATYAGPFALGIGSHTIAFQSIDFAGNQEALQTEQVGIVSQNNGFVNSNGLGIGADARNQVWEVVQNGDEIDLVRYSTGGLQSVTMLSQAVKDGVWTIDFDTATGEAYAVGTSSTSAGEVFTVYEVSAVGALISSSSVAGVLSSNQISLDSTGGLWITGASASGGKNSPLQATLALWRYSPQTRAISLVGSYARGGGLDGGMGVRVLNGTVWVSGYSLNPSNASAGGPVDLLLLGFNPTTGHVSAGPFFKPNFLSGIGQETWAKLVALNGNLFIGAARTGNSGETDLAFEKYDPNGNNLLDESWISSNGLSAGPEGMRTDVSSNIYVGGFLRSQVSTTTQLGVWKYRPNGTLLAAVTVPNVPAARGIAFQQPNNIWLAIDGSSVPFLLAGAQPLAGTEVLISSRAADILPPRTTLAISTPTFSGAALYVSSSTTFALSAVDDASVLFDSAGIVAQSFVAIDTQVYSPYAGPFSLRASGLHSISYYSVDQAGNVESPHVASVVADTTPPVTNLLVDGAPAAPPYLIVSTDTLSFTATDVQSGVQKTMYSLDGSALQTSSSTFTLSIGTHTLSFLSVDNVGNVESAHLVTTTVRSPVTTPPSISLSPINASTVTASAPVIVAVYSAASGASVASVRFVLDGTDVTSQATITSSSATYRPSSLAQGAHSVAVTVTDNYGDVGSATSSFYIDSVPPSLTLNPANGGTVTTSTQAIVASYSDAGTGVNLSSLRLALDGTAVAPAVGSSSATFVPPSPFSQGQHTVTAAVADNAGNVSYATSTWTLDSLPPVTTLLLDGVVASTPSVTAFTSDTFSLSAFDAGTGVARTIFSIDGSAQSIYFTQFSLGAGAHTIAYQSVDSAGNVEPLKTESVSVRTPPSAPSVALLSPSGIGGFESEAKGSVPVIGSVGGQSLMSWKLEYAAGQNAPFGFTQISSGSLSAQAAILGYWNTASLSGWQTLRLSASNATGQTSSAVENVYVGDPSLLVDISTAMSGPSGVAVGASGLIYVADTGNNRIDVFTAQGTFQTSYPNGNGQAFGLNAPQGVATDIFGNIYVADSNGKRALKLSSLGALTLSIPINGKPIGIAVDRAGYIYVSDNSNAQVVKFSPAGSQVQVFSLAKSKPAGVAVDAAGNVYVADTKSKAVAVFNSSATLINTLGTSLNMARPFGVAVSTDGNVIVVSDMANDRVLSLDALGQQTMAFGGPSSGLSGPRGLALDAAGELYMAEAPVNQVLKLGPPPAGMAPVAFATRLVVLGQSSAFVTASVGGKIQRQDNAVIIVPPGALPDDSDVSISSPTVRLQQEEDLKKNKLKADGLIQISVGAAFAPDGIRLNTPATVVLPYDPAAAASAGLPELSLRLSCWNPDKQDWIWMPSRVNPTNHTVAAPTMRLGLCEVVGPKNGN